MVDLLKFKTSDIKKYAFWRKICWKIKYYLHIHALASKEVS